MPVMITKNTIINTINREIVFNNYDYNIALDKLKDIAVRYNINENDFVDNYIGLINNNMQSSLKLTNEDKRKLHILCINKKYKDYRENNGILYNFDFVIGKIIPIGYDGFIFKNKILKLYRHFENILTKYIDIFKRNPSYKVYYELAHKYNMSINYINQHFKNDMTVPFEYAIEPNDIKIKRNAFKSALYYCPLLSLEYDENELSDWKKEYMRLEKEYGNEWLKNHRPDIYNKMTHFHKNEKIVVHGQHCSWLKKDLPNVAKSINSFLSNKKYNSGIITSDNINIFCKDFNKYTNFGRNKHKNFSGIITVGDVCIRCICIKDNYIQCNALFNLSDIETYNKFKKCFSSHIIEHKYDDDIFIQDPVEYMFERLDSLLDPSKRPSIRTCSKCPKCEYINTFENKEAILNSSGTNPLLKHPSDVICGNPICNYNYCTDCKLSHPGFICRGFPEEEDTAKDIEACPACGHITNRIDGCTCMTCAIPTCRKTWCWICRCIRYPEQNPDNINYDLLHYCMDDNRYQSNPNWYNNPDFIPYKNIAPKGQEGMDFIPA